LTAAGDMERRHSDELERRRPAWWGWGEGQARRRPRKLEEEARELAGATFAQEEQWRQRWSTPVAEN
jgi:hypothetical protein